MSPQSEPGPPTQILGVVLGSAKFPHLPGHTPELGRAFSRSKAAIARYLNQLCGPEAVLDCFGSRMLPNQLCLRIDQFLRARPLSTDLIVYYVGHGDFLSRREYFLGCYATREDNKSATGLRMDDLADTIIESFRNRRAYIVIDCCFAASSVDSFQGAADDLIERQAQRLPSGIALLNASSRDDVALAPAGAFRTMFSDSLARVLREGIRTCGPLLSLRDIGKAVTDLILEVYDRRAVRPEVHSPRQRRGDVADFPLFPNPGFVELTRHISREHRTSETENTVTVPQLAELYRFPKNLDGAGQCIGIIHLGDMPDMSGLKTYCTELGVQTPQIDIVIAEVKRGATLIHGRDHLMLSMQVCASVAPAARQVIYVAQSTSAGFVAAIEAAASDEENNPCVLLLAWGSAESSWTAEAMAAVDNAILSATKRGITVCCATGNAGATCGMSDGTAHVSFPASSPYALACGCTSLQYRDGIPIGEIAWDRGGGGFSEVFPAPNWQTETSPEQWSSSGMIGRGIPDVSAHAGLDHPIRAYLSETWTAVGGSTASSALWAALIALINQGVGERFAFTPELFHRHFGPAGTLNDIVSGRNGKHPGPSYSASPGWDPCTGWGTPNGAALLIAAKLYLSLRSAAVAGRTRSSGSGYESSF
jgi:hypothetical protein